MGKLESLHHLVNELPTGFTIDPETGILYHSNHDGKEKIGKVSLAEQTYLYSFVIYFEKYGKERFFEYKQYYESIRDALAGKKFSCGKKVNKKPVILASPLPKL